MPFRLFPSSVPSETSPQRYIACTAFPFVLQQRVNKMLTEHVTAISTGDMPRELRHHAHSRVSGLSYEASRLTYQSVFLQ